MSKATYNNQFRACLFRVACIDWQGNPFARGMSRLYSVSLSWEIRDSTGCFSGKFGHPVQFASETPIPWGTVVTAVRQHLRLSAAWNVSLQRDWVPFYLVSGDPYSVRMTRELRSIVAREYGSRGTFRTATSVPVVASPEAGS